MNRMPAGRRPLLAVFRRGIHLGLGGMLILREKMHEFAEQAIERGQAFETEGKKLVQERRSQGRRRRPERMDVLDVRVENALNRLHLPTGEDLAELEQQITRLAQQVDQLAREDHP